MSADISALAAWLTSSAAACPALVLPLRNTKTARLGETLRKRIPAVPGAVDCPVHALAAYLALRVEVGRCGLTEPEFLLPAGNPPSVSWFNTSIKRLLRDCDVPEHARYSSHSLRHGATTTARARGATDVDLQALGAWTSNAFEGYIAEPARQACAARAYAALHARQDDRQ